MGHTYANILVHVIFSTKERRPAITPDIQPRLREYLAGVARQEFGRAICIGGTADHLHGLISLSTSVSIGEAMRKWKSLSSGWVHKSFGGHGAFAWQSGYGAFSVSEPNAAAAVAYIDAQAEHHRRQTFQEEFIAFLDRHKVAYDPRHVWD